MTSLCESCRHCREVFSAKGSRFLLCLLSQTDIRFVKYPRQPVMRCDGHEQLDAADDKAKLEGG